MEEQSRFRVYDSKGNKYEIIEYLGADGTEYRTTDGHAVVRLDRTNFEINKRNPRTNEPKIAVFR